MVLLPEDAHGISGSAAGRDGFWLHRCLVTPGVEHHGVDAAHLVGTRRPRRAQTARLAGHTRRTMRRHHLAGAWQVWSVVRVPSVAAEDRWQLHCERLTAKRNPGEQSPAG